MRFDTPAGVGHQMAFWEARNVPPARPRTMCQVSSGMAGTGVFQTAPLPASGLIQEWQHDSRGLGSPARHRGVVRSWLVDTSVPSSRGHRPV